MNPVDRIIGHYESIVASQERVSGQLGFLTVLLVVGVSVGFVLLLLEAIAIITRRQYRRNMERVLARIEDEGRENRIVLEIVKAWAESARSHSQDARDATKRLETAVPEIVQVPERTAEKVGEVVGKVKAVGAVALLFLSVLPVGRTDAAEELRERNEAIALEWVRAGSP